MVRYGFVIDLTRCISCYSCVAACTIENLDPSLWDDSDKRRIRLRGGEDGVYPPRIEIGEYPNVMRIVLPMPCFHCENPPCVKVCPVGATYKRDDGIVIVEQEKCIGCGYCIVACPYGSRFRNHITGTVDKCNLCIHRIEAGEEPACVETCVGGALHLVDFDDPNDEYVREAFRRRAFKVECELGTQPAVYYIPSR